MLAHQVRQTFIDYFVHNGHRAMPSSSLIPYGDNSILFTNAGMNQFKNAFLGLEKRDYTRAVTSQKVMRVSGKHNDLENVGPSKRHHTFFEMLGNFSFGDYFKAEAMGFALELLTKEYGFDRDRMWFTIYKDDDESYALWQRHGIAADRILRFGEKDNFWSMGDTGPCGPSSEIHYFTGDSKADNLAKWVNNDEDGTERTVEIWNLVFMQFNRTQDKVLNPLPQTGVDTGMGFERLVRLLQKVENNYESDLFIPILDSIQQLARQTDAQRTEQLVAYRVIADHVRAAAFLIGDGVLPGNVGRNYVLRMVMRRAMRFGRKLGFEGPFLYQVAQSVIDKMGGYYTELVARRDHILKTIHVEEERFERTLDQGLTRLDEVIAQTSGSVIAGEPAYKLYDTYGLPLEITRDIAKEKGYTVDEVAFDAAKTATREKNKGSGAFGADYAKASSYGEIVDALKNDGALPPTGVTHDLYGSGELTTEIAAILLNGEETDHAVAGETFEVVLKATPFYVDSGGQVSDSGELRSPNGAWRMRVLTTHRPAPGFIVHVCNQVEGEPRVGEICFAQVDHARRAHIMRNHTATHLLQRSLRDVLGDHVGQQGSSVDEHRLRFDFSHGAAMTEDELARVGDKLNQAILDNIPVTAHEMKYDDAIKAGAMAFFSEKYGDVVRVVSIGEFSKELCGGTHVRATGDIGAAVIATESGVSAGVRRIEVLTGQGALALFQQQRKQLATIAKTIGASGDVAESAQRMADQLKETQRQLEIARRELAEGRFASVLNAVESVNGAAALVAQVTADSNDQLRDMSDWFRARHPSGVAVLASVINDKPAIVVSVSQDLNKKGVNAGALIKEIAAVVGGSGGGRPNLAQAGGKDAAKIGDALSKARTLVQQALQ
jgi:alanyl-tRNA synthetase